MGVLLVGAGCASSQQLPTSGQSTASSDPSGVIDSARTLATLEVIAVRPSLPGYDRSCAAGRQCVFGPAWSDDVTVEYGHNGCSTRDDILRVQLRNVVTKTGTNGCVVISGDLDDPYTGTHTHYAKSGEVQVAVDHVVALAASWDLGAHQWSLAQRRNFANDPRNLLVTTASANTAKGELTPAQWRPATPAGRCLYAQRYIEVSDAYALPVTTADRAALLQNLGDCGR
ncbi:MAG: HNH endonuclease family protein [Dermatophilaceae bacterium]